MDSPEGLASLIVAVATLLGVLWQGWKTSAEVAKLKREVKPVREAIEPNHGSSLKDQVSRIERRQHEMGRSIGGIRDDLRDERAERRALHADANAEHVQINARLDRLERLRGKPERKRHQ